MVDQLTVTERDLRRCSTSSTGAGRRDPRRCSRESCCGRSPSSSRPTTSRYQVSRPLDREFVGLEEVGDDRIDLEDGWEDLFWRSYWEGETCCRPQLTGDYDTRLEGVGLPVRAADGGLDRRRVVPRARRPP